MTADVSDVELTRGQRREARIALAMLPVGGLFLLVSAIAFVAVMAGAVVALAMGGWPWSLLLWCIFAAVVAAWNARAGIEMMSAFDWRPLPLALLLSAAVVTGWLALP
ncbi:hypothetical protein [uncultured Sphingomonas sp.]|uniref:hypothetical protein n=1 Tax=uncultured Sphingomonas sp. TaxID=158754 RepID=UPI0035CA63BD